MDCDWNASRKCFPRDVVPTNEFFEKPGGFIPKPNCFYTRKPLARGTRYTVGKSTSVSPSILWYPSNSRKHPKSVREWICTKAFWWGFAGSRNFRAQIAWRGRQPMLFNSTSKQEAVHKRARRGAKASSTFCTFWRLHAKMPFWGPWKHVLREITSSMFCYRQLQMAAQNVGCFECLDCPSYGRMLLNHIRPQKIAACRVRGVLLEITEHLHRPNRRNHEKNHSQ